jgi:SAM-dependent methyltransferase
MYDANSTYWSQTRSKKYRTTGTSNWPIVQSYLDQLKSGDSLLDVGCGNGRLISGLKQTIRYTGIDFSEKLLQEAQTLYPTSDFRFGDIVDETLWKNIDTYNALFCIAVLHHIPERTQQLFILREMKRHTLADGFLFLTVWNLWQERFLQYHLDSINLKQSNERWVEIPFQKTQKRFCFQMDVPYLADLFKETGWDIDDIFYANHDGNRADIQTGQNLVVVAR